MFLKRNQLTRQKVIGGSLLGNLYNKAKGVLYNTSKILAPKVKSIGKMTAQKALEAAKEQITPDMVFDLAKDLAKGDRKAVKMKVKKEAKQLATTIGKDKAINPHVRDTINQLSNNKDIKRVLLDKSKELLQDNQRAILSNIIAGSGMKRL